ncbi:ABC transporter substrate-binding protein [Sinosporangium siamense]|uniref:ABC transporter substrate-binding protein n=1 Tax=Sinosporangium siamense TaxID=1367973 RepID=A0A919V7S3_9ACTN|nr:ABC transporter substrate-binding protein [Sinosporangium siamense]GII95415.1 ABC transporter substrate-binding protein [Sinosporangium siamense]
MFFRSPPGRLACATLALGLTLTACGGADRGSGKAEGGKPQSAASEADIDKIVWGMAGNPSMIDIAHGLDGASTVVQTVALDTLLTLTAEGKPAPAVAESWERADPTTYVYKIRKDVKFWDGSPVTAEDVAYSLARHMDPKVASQAGSFLTAMKEVKVTGDHEVTAKLKRPDTSFEYVAASAWQIVKKSFAEKHLRDLGSPTVLTMGTGKFKLVSFSPATGAVLERNEHYWGQKPKIKRLEFKVVSDSETRRLALQSGQIDGTFDIDTQNARRWTTLPNVQTFFARANAVRYFSFDVKNKPFDDVYVRKAFAHSLDRNALKGADARMVLADNIVTEPQLVALFGKEGAAQFVAGLPKYEFDMAKAKAALAQSKYASGFTLDVVHSNRDQFWSKLLQSLAQNLKTIGVTLNIKAIPNDAYVAKLYGHQDLGMNAVNAAFSTPDPAELLPVMLGESGTKPNGFNLANYTNPELEKNLTALANTVGAERQEAVKNIVTEVADQVPYMPLYYDENGMALNKKYVFTQEFTTWSGQDWSALIKRAA